MNRASKIKKIPPGSKVTVVFTLAERKLIEEEILLDSDIFHFAIVEEKSIVVKITLDDLEEFTGYVAAVANHCPNTKHQTRLDRLFDKLDRVMNSYDDSGD